jgi:hypothetical protein
MIREILREGAGGAELLAAPVDVGTRQAVELVVVVARCLCSRA